METTNHMYLTILLVQNLRRVKEQLVAELATCAAEATEASIRERLADVSK